MSAPCTRPWGAHECRQLSEYDSDLQWMPGDNDPVNQQARLHKARGIIDRLHKEAKLKDRQHEAELRDEIAQWELYHETQLHDLGEARQDFQQAVLMAIRRKMEQLE